MGNTIFSAGAFVAVKIDDPGTHFGGKTVKGRVYLDVQKSSVTADSLNIRFYGQERSCVVYYVTVGHGKKRHRERRHAHATVKFFEVDYILHSYGGEVQQGRYEYPFEITLPVGIPGKLGGSSGDSYFLIDYHIEARLHRQGMLTWDVHNSVEILMLDPPYNRIPTPVFSTPSTVPVHSFCCIRSGTMTLAIKLDSNNVVGSEVFRAFYEISNQSTSRIKALEISVLQNLECRADGHVHQSSSTVFHERIDASQLQNVAPIAKQDANLSSEQPEQGAIKALLDSLSRGQHFLNVTIPNTWAPTLLGALGAITYTLRVHIKTPFGVEDPLVDCALILHRTALSFVGVIPVVAQEYTLPPGWQPMNAIAPVQFSVPRFHANLPHSYYTNYTSHKICIRMCLSIEALSLCIQGGDRQDST